MCCWFCFCVMRDAFLILVEYSMATLCVVPIDKQSRQYTAEIYNISVFWQIVKQISAVTTQTGNCANLFWFAYRPNRQLFWDLDGTETVEIEKYRYMASQWPQIFVLFVIHSTFVDSVTINKFSVLLLLVVVLVLENTCVFPSFRIGEWYPPNNPFHGKHLYLKIPLYCTRIQ